MFASGAMPDGPLASKEAPWENVCGDLPDLLVRDAGWAVWGHDLSPDVSSCQALNSRVASTWGSAQRQSPPIASFIRTVKTPVESWEDGKKIVRTVERKETHVLPLEKSRIRVDLDLEHRQKGLLWYSTYKVGFAGEYLFLNTGEIDQVTFTLPFPASQAIYDDLAVSWMEARRAEHRVGTPPRVPPFPAPPPSRRPHRRGCRSAIARRDWVSWRSRAGQDVAQCATSR